MGALDGEDDDDDDAGGVDDEDEEDGALDSVPGIFQCRRPSPSTRCCASSPVGNGSPTQRSVRATLKEMAKTESFFSTTCSHWGSSKREACQNGVKPT